MFRVKGVELSLALLARVRSACAAQGTVQPILLVFGSLSEDPDYTEEVQTVIADLELEDNVRLLDGVPLTSFCDSMGNWHLDEIDLLRISAATNGGVFFTPNRADVESVGLGPALAAKAGLPCAVTSYAALTQVFGPEFHWIAVAGVDHQALSSAAADFVGQMLARKNKEPLSLAMLNSNRRRVREVFPAQPWRKLLQWMGRSATSGSHRQPVIPASSSARLEGH
jgi:glycosyltransferase involved in cell wall biosynthesis